MRSTRTDPGPFARLRWGLVPPWAADLSAGRPLINARSETVAELPSFRAAFRRRRCLVLADGFYEWQKHDDGRKQPYLIGVGDQEPFAFAGLWERWEREGTAAVESCALLTCAANGLMRPLHERMPVILPPGAYDLWLDPTVQEPGRLLPLLRPHPEAGMFAYPVSTWVNSPRHDDARCVRRVGLPG